MRTTIFFFLLASLWGRAFAQLRTDRVADVSIAWSLADRIGYAYDRPAYVLPAEVRSSLNPGDGARHTGCLNAGLLVSVGRGWSLGFALGYTRLSADGETNHIRQGYRFSGRHVFSRTVLAFETRKVYYSHKSTRCYARVGIGGAGRVYRFEFANGGANGDSRSAPVMHVSPVGVSVGERLRGFAELGYGYRGIVSIGAAVRF